MFELLNAYFSFESGHTKLNLALKKMQGLRPLI